MRFFNMRFFNMRSVVALVIMASALLLAPSCTYATGELRATDTTGKTLYAVVVSPSSQAWNGTAFAAIANANWSTYANTMTEQGTTGIYVGTFPASIATAGQYGVLVYEEVTSGTAAVGDRLVASGVREWSGTSLVTLTGVNLQTVKIGTNNADSPNEVAAQGNAATAASGSTANAVTLALLKSGQILGTGSVTSATPPTQTAFSTTLTASTDLISGDGLVFTSGVNAGKNIHILTNSAGLFGLPGAGLANAPSAGDTFVLIPFSKSLTNYLSVLGADNKPLLSASDTQAGIEAVAQTVTTIPAAGTTTGIAETLTNQQSQALLLSLSAGGVTNTAPAASSTGTVTYYLVGRPKTTANVVAVSSPTFDATRTISGRTVLIQQPFPAL